jgi:hypothetical protein
MRGDRFAERHVPSSKIHPDAPRFVDNAVENAGMSVDRLCATATPPERGLGGRDRRLFANDADAELGRDVGVQPDLHRRLAECFDRLVEVDPPPLDLHVVPGEEIGDVL